GPHLARELEAAVAVVDSEEQRAQAHARPFGLGEAADHKFLPRQALDLEPRSRAGGLVGSVAALRNDAFVAQPAGLLVELFARSRHVIAVVEGRASPRRGDAGPER